MTGSPSSGQAHDGQHTLKQQVCGQAISVHLPDAVGPLSLPGAVLLTGDFNKGAQRGENKQIAPPVAAFSRTSVSWPSHGYRLLWVPGGMNCPHPNAVGVAFLLRTDVFSWCVCFFTLSLWWVTRAFTLHLRGSRLIGSCILA